MGFDKILTPILGRPLIRHTVEAFAQSASISSIVVVFARERETEMRAALGANSKVHRLAPGGQTRQESVRNGLDAVDAGIEFVAVHDAARPLITPIVIDQCVAAAISHGAAAVAEPETDTLQRTDESGRCIELVSRENLWRIQTPQVFALDALRQAMDAVIRDGVSVTDETSACMRSGGSVVLVANPEWNFKVTVPRDVAVAEFILQSRAAASMT